MAFKKPTVHKIKPDIRNASVYYRAEPKFGKTTTFRDVILEKFGDPEYGLLIKCGAENGDTMIDEVNSVQVETWDEVKELAEWLIEQKGKEHRIEIIAFDTVDELIKMAEIEAMKVSYKESRDAGKPLKPRSVNQAFGGFGKGGAYVVNNLLTPLIGKLKANFGLWCIAHTKMKVNTKSVDSLNNEMAVQQLTSNLDSRYEACVNGLLDIIVTGAFENSDIIGATEIGMVNNKKNVNLVDATKQTRRLYFRSTAFVDAGSRFADFADIPESMVYEFNQDNAKKFIEIVELGMEKSKLKYRQNNNTSQPAKAETEKIETIKEDLSIPAEDDLPIEEVEWVEPSKDEILQMVIDRFKACGDKEVKKQVREISGGAINKETDIEVLKQILEILE